MRVHTHLRDILTDSKVYMASCIFPLGFALGKRPTHTEEQKFIFVRFQNQDRTN